MYIINGDEYPPLATQMKIKYMNMKKSRFEEIIPASDLLKDELNDIRGGGIICDSGAVCDVGEVTDDQESDFRLC